MAEIELSALTVQCLLNVRIPTIEDLNKILSAWSQKKFRTKKVFLGILRLTTLELSFLISIQK